jgi:hypothetical protein
VLVAWLKEQGWTVVSAANTAARTQGVDIIAWRERRLLWVSVKGYPERSHSVQAGHWLAGAVFDLVRYRHKEPAVELALGLPDGFARYRNLAPQTAWLQKAMPFRIYWVTPEGQVKMGEKKEDGSAPGRQGEE